MRGDDEGEYCQKAVCEKAAEAKAATSDCMQEDCKKVGEERVLLKHPCSGRLQKASAAKATVCARIAKSKRCRERLCVRGL